MTDPKELVKYFEEIPEEYRSRAFICGGAVLDLRKASDIDIFILDCQEDEELRRVQKYIDEMSRSDTDELSGGTWSDEDSSDKKAVTFYNRDGKKINVICAEEKTIRELLESFDISTSRWAVNSKGRLGALPSSTKPGEPIMVYYLSKTTLQRIQKYCSRFGTGWKGRERG